MWQQLSVYPMGLTKTYSGIYYDCNNNNKCSKKISNSMKQNKMVLINKTFKKNKTTWYQTADLYWSGQKNPRYLLAVQVHHPVIHLRSCKDHSQKKKAWSKINITLGGSFSIKFTEKPLTIFTKGYILSNWRVLNKPLAFILQICYKFLSNKMGVGKYQTMHLSNKIDLSRMLHQDYFWFLKYKFKNLSFPVFNSCIEFQIILLVLCVLFPLLCSKYYWFSNVSSCA